VGSSETAFPRLVTLAAHDLRTPLATIHGFAQTLVRMGDLGEPKQRYVEMIDAASRQLAELLDELGIAARIESGRYEPNLQPVDTLDLARGAAEELGEDRVAVSGEGAEVRGGLDATQRGGSAHAQASARWAGAGRGARRRLDAPCVTVDSVVRAGASR
jgi:signal transduction histidine kinase